MINTFVLILIYISIFILEHLFVSLKWNVLHVQMGPMVKVADCVFHFSFGWLSTPRFIIIRRIQNWTGWVSGSHIAIQALLDKNKILTQIFISSYLKSRHSHSADAEFSVITSTCCRINCIYQEHELYALPVPNITQFNNSSCHLSCPRPCLNYQVSFAKGGSSRVTIGWPGTIDHHRYVSDSRPSVGAG